MRPLSGFAVLGLWLSLAGTAAWSQGVVVDGEVESTSDGFVFPNGSVQTRAFDGYSNFLTVALAGGDFTSIQAAIDIAEGDAAADNRYLVLVAPGEYAESVEMKPFIDLRGSGVGTTIITAGGSPAADSATVETDSGSVLEQLSVVNTGGDQQAIGILCSASATLRNLSVSASGGVSQSQGILITAGTPTITDTVVTATGGSLAYGIANNTASSFIETLISRVEVTALDGDSSSIGILNVGGSKPVLKDVIAEASGATINQAIRSQGTDIRLIRVTATAIGSGTTNQAFSSIGAGTPLIRDSVLTAAGAASSVGIHLDASAGPARDVYVDRSEIVGNTASIRTATDFDVFVGFSQLGGGAVDTTSGGSVSCVAVWDKSFVGTGTTCP